MNIVWRMVVLGLSLSLNTVLSGEDYEGYRVLREGVQLIFIYITL